jgi:predicted DNA-binding transcriptional regulator AlpA
MLEKDDGTIALACNLAILMNDFNNVLGPNDIFVEGARMVEGRRQGPAVRSEKSASARAEARRAANDLFKDAPVYRLTPKKAAREMLRRGESGEPGGITGVNESTLRGYIRDLCGTGQSRTWDDSLRFVTIMPSRSPPRRGLLLNGRQMFPEFLDVAETANRLGVSASFLNKARLAGDGPRYLKIGKTVRYEWSTVLKWLEEQTRRSTSESR